MVCVSWSDFVIFNYVVLLELAKASSSIKARAFVSSLLGGSSMQRWRSVVIACNFASEVILLVPERLTLYSYLKKKKYEWF